MQTVEQKISTAQWMLERQLQWVAQAEVKVGALITLDVGMLGGLAAAHAATKVHFPWATLLSAFAVAGMIGALFFSAMSLIPRLRAPHTSILFFGAIAAQKAADFVADASEKKSEQILEDWLFQVHRNAEIARDKHVWVRKAMYASFIAAAFWIAAVLLLVEV